MNQRRNKLKQLHAEIEKMRKDLQAKDKELERSKQILSEKDEELRRIKKIAMLSPKDVNAMANDKNSIEVLQQIAIENQLSPNVWSPSSRLTKENKSILNHPFYQNLPQKQQENFTYFAKSNSEKASNIKSDNKENSREFLFKDSSKLIDNTSGTRQPKLASKRYYNRLDNWNNDDSFQSYSSISGNNEESGNFLNNQSESYTHRRDTHKVQMLEKNGLIQIENKEEAIKEITPIKDNKVESLNTTPNNNWGSNNKGSYLSNYAKRKSANEWKSKNGRFIKAKSDIKSNTEERPRSVVSKVPSKSSNSHSWSSTSKVVDLKEKRYKEKQKKIGLFGTDFSSIFANGNIWQINRNYGLTAPKTNNGEDLEPGNNTIAQQYNINQNKFKIKEGELHTQKSYTNLQYKNNQNENSTSEDMIKEVVIGRREVPNSAKYNSSTRLTLQFIKQQPNKHSEDMQLNKGISSLIDNSINFANNQSENIIQDTSEDMFAGRFATKFIQKY